MTPAPNQPPVLAAALAFADAGCSVIPVATDGTKRPVGAWKPYQDQPASRQQVEAWFADGHPGLGIVTGAVSGNLLMIELEGRAVAEGMLAELAEIAMASGLGDLWTRVTRRGYLEATPSGGVHLLVRVLQPISGNLKLARRPGPDDLTTGRPTIEVLAETRGEGGFVVVAPSHGPVHATGKPWIRAVGDPTTIPDLTPDQADALLTLFRCLDRMPPPPTPAPAAPVSSDPASAFLHGTTAPSSGTSPGDDYNTRTSWSDLLTPAGWTPVRQHGREVFWRRPGKTDGISATTGYGEGDWLYVFTSSTELPTEQTLTKFAVYTHLEHGGDYSTAARTLRSRGYGTPPPEQPRPAPPAGASTPPDAEAKDTLTAATSSAAGVPAPPPGPTTYSRTDDGNAVRLIDTHHHQLRYCPQRAQWLAWDGHRWRWDHAGAVHELARTLARDLPHDNDEDRRHRTRSLSAQRLRAIVNLATTDTRIVTNLDQLDARPYELNTPAGVIDLRTGQLRQPDPNALHTRSTAIAPAPGTPDRWLKFLADTFAGDPAMTTYVQRLLGLSLIGAVLEQILPFAYGEGANGKTTLLGTVQRLVGLGEDGYAQAAQAEMLLATANAGHPTEVARLAGARLVVSSELEDGQRFAEAKVKQLTGRDALSGRFMRQDFFTFSPTHSLWLLANHMPAVRAGGMAFWRRVRLLPFLHTVPPEQRDPHLEDHLVDQEGPQILAWLAQGAADYLRDGLAEPAAVKAATSAYERDQDTVARFVDDACIIGPGDQQGMRVKMAEVRQAYEHWCHVEGEQPVSAKALGLTLRSRYGVQTDRDRSTRWYTGIRLDATDQSQPSSDTWTDGDQTAWWGR